MVTPKRENTTKKKQKQEQITRYNGTKKLIRMSLYVW